MLFNTFQFMNPMNLFQSNRQVPLNGFNQSLMVNRFSQPAVPQYLGFRQVSQPSFSRVDLSGMQPYFGITQSVLPASPQSHPIYNMMRSAGQGIMRSVGNFARQHPVLTTAGIGMGGLAMGMGVCPYGGAAMTGIGMAAQHQFMNQ